MEGVPKNGYMEQINKYLTKIQVVKDRKEDSSMEQVQIPFMEVCEPEDSEVEFHI